MTRLLMVGPPGVGKGTQAALLSSRFDVPAISTGEIFREQVKLRTPMGVRAEAIILAGNYVPDDLTNELVANRLDQDDCRNGFILDGYPRTRDQVGELDRLLAMSGVNLDLVIHLDSNAEPLISRLIKRGLEKGRSDDTPDAIQHRITVYQQLTAPVIEAYKRRNLLVTVNALDTVEAVTEAIMNALMSRLGPIEPPSSNVI